MSNRDKLDQIFKLVCELEQLLQQPVVPGQCTIQTIDKIKQTILK